MARKIRSEAALVGTGKNKKTPLKKGSCAQDWNRTSTFLRTADFESAASTNSATWANVLKEPGGLQCYNIPPNCLRRRLIYFFLK